MKFSTEEEAPAGIPLAPLIDIMFLLVCFFAVSQIHAQYDLEMKVTLPTSESGKTPETLPGEVVVNVMKDGSYRFLGRQHTAEDIGKKLRVLVSNFPDQSIIIRGDAEAQHQALVAILDECTKNDITKIRIATLPEAEGGAP